MPAYRGVNSKGELSGACHFEFPDMQKMLLEEDGVEVTWNGKENVKFGKQGEAIMVEKYGNGRGLVTLSIAAWNIIAWLINITAGGGSFWGLFLFGGGYAKQFGEATFQAIVMDGGWWRLLTCGYLHIGIFHLGFNLHAMIMIVGKMESCLGRFKTFVGYHLGTVVTAFLWCLLFRNGSIVGASLGIYAALGILFALNKRDASRRYLEFSRAERNYLVTYVIGGCFLGIGTIAVHLIGMVVGGMLGSLYCGLQKNN